LRGPDEDEYDEELLVIKLMKDEDSWKRELKLREEFTVSENDVVTVKCAATLRSDAIDFDCEIPIEACPGLDDKVS